MSSDRLERKRRIEFDNSDDSADEIPPLKVLKSEQSSYFSKVITDKFKTLLNWLTPSVVKNYMIDFMRNSFNSSGSGEENMGMADGRNSGAEDEDEISVIAMQNGTVPRSHTYQKHNNHSKSVIIPTFCSMAASPLNYPGYTELSRARYSERKPMNGLVYKGNAKEHLRNEEAKHISHITSSNSEPEIIIDKEISRDDKDVEVLCEVSRSPARQRTHLPDINSSRKDKMKYTEELLSSSIRLPRKIKHHSKSTAEEVLRLNEKKQYQMLLNKVMKQTYLPSTRPHWKSTVEVDLTEDEDRPTTIFQFKKEKVENVKNFVSRYMKPIDIVPYSEVRSGSLGRSVTKSVSESDDDDEVQVIADLPKLAPRKKILNSGIFSREWLDELKTTIDIDKSHRLQLIAEQQEKIDRCQKRRDAKNAEKQKKIDEMKAAGVIFPEDVEMEEEVLPEITPDMHRVIQAAFAPGDMSEIFRTISHLGDLRRNDIKSLEGLNWLNDMVINFYMDLIMERSKLDNFPSVHCFTSFFYTSMKTSGNKRLMRWTRKIDIFSYDLLFIPLHLGVHWALIAIDNRVKTVKYYDSMSCSEEMCLLYIRQYLIDEMMDKKKQVLDPNEYRFEIAKDIPKQMNGSDCGMFTLKYAEYLARDAPITFTQNHMPYFRLRMVYELLTNQIL